MDSGTSLTVAPDTRIRAYLSASAELKVRPDEAASRHDRVVLRRPLMSVVRFLSAQPGGDPMSQVQVSVDVEMKVPDALPQPFAMLTVRVGVVGMVAADSFETQRRQLMGVAAAAVMSDLDELARIVKGRPPFSAEEVAAARALSTVRPDQTV